MRPLSLLKNTRQETRVIHSRMIMLGILSITLLSSLIGRLYYLQVLDHETQLRVSNENRIGVLPIPPTRGIIYANNGEPLAQNRTSFTLTFTPEASESPEQTLKHLFSIMKFSEKKQQQILKGLSKHTQAFKPFIIQNHLSDEEVARIAVRRHELPGIQTTPHFIRYYPFNEVTAHILGYVSQMNDKDIQRLKANQTFKNYAGTQFIGKKGIELSQEDRLHGRAGYRLVETNAKGRVVQTLESYPPIAGQDLLLTIDLNLQKKATQLIQKHRKGSIVALDPETGEIKAMVSHPSFNNNLFVTGISLKDYNALNTNPNRPLFNRSVQGQYPPASTVKPFIGLLGLHLGTITPSTKIYDPGYFQLPNYPRRYRDWKRSGHGFMNLHDSIVQSCDTYFYELGLKLGIDPMHDFMKQFQFGQTTGLEVQGESKGLIPSAQWKLNTLKAQWFPGETLIAAIGQGYMLTTPLQLAVATGGLATRGRVMKPRLIQGVKSKDPLQTWDYKPAEILSQVEAEHPIDQAHWDLINQSMVDVVYTLKGTGKKAGTGLSIQIAGKTGTAQVVGIKQDEQYDPETIAQNHADHALFIGYAPVTSPKIAVAIIIENGGGGGATAAPIANELFKTYLNQSNQ